MSRECMLTTIDNPYDPFEQFIPWFLFDVEKGYNSCSRLARVMESRGISLFGDLSQKEIDDASEQAIDSIVKNDPFNLFVKAVSNDSDDTSSG